LLDIFRISLMIADLGEWEGVLFLSVTQQVNLLVTPPSEPLAPVLIDPICLEQILTNLLSNALGYTPPGGQVDLAVASTSTTVLVCVHDSGPGIPPEALPYIFGRFYRVEKSRTRMEGGGGLGLAIARQLARAHGGDLKVVNHPSGGAVFTLILP
jgi:signal transduction histidine kinase